MAHPVRPLHLGRVKETLRLRVPGMTKRRRQQGNGAGGLDLIEEAIAVLRSAPSSYWLTYYTGTLPFVLAVLYFWADMSRSPFAEQHLIGGALALTGLFLWMKTCQAVFARRLLGLVSGQISDSGSGQLWQTFLNQAALQPSGLFLLPLAAIPALPLGWLFAFYQNLSVLDDGQASSVRRLLRRATRQAMLWPGQNHVVLAIMTCFGLFVALNLLSACFLLPGLIKMLLGVETVFTRSGLSLLNTTLLAATLAMTYLCLDPILKAVYVLRCFYGDAQQSGADLKAVLARAPNPLSLPLIATLGFLVLGPLTGMGRAAERSLPSASAAQQAIPATPPTVDSAGPVADLDRAIQEVIQQPKYAWREPRRTVVHDSTRQRGFFGRMLDRLKPLLKNAAKAVFEWLDRVLRRLFARQRAGSPGDAAGRWVTFLHLLLYGLLAATVLGLLWLGYRVWGKRPNRAVVAGEPVLPMPDLTDEHVGADQLPEESWLALAHELLAKGELRLALRAFYLANLAQLASRNLIQLARFKCNSDYERELRRRAHALPILVQVFHENLFVFDRTWYGMYPLDRACVDQFARNIEQMRTEVAPPAPAAA